MLRVGDTVEDMHPHEFDGGAALITSTGIIWDVVAVEPRDDGKYVATLERFADGKMITASMVCSP